MSTKKKRPPAALRFACALGEQPTWLVPRRLLPPDSQSQALLQLNVNARCWLGRRTMPASVAERTRPPGQFHDGSIVWVGGINPGVTPFWLGPRLSALIGTTRPGKPAPKELSARERVLLVAAGILVDVGYLERQRRHVGTVVSQAAQWFRDGYAPLSGLIHPFALGALRLYYRRLVRHGAFRLGDRRTSLRFAAHNEPVAAHFHRQLAGVVGAIVGRPVKPSFVYFSAYQPGATLDRHTDREQCEYSISLLVDATPEPLRESPWPLYLETRRGAVTVFQCIGDGLLYRGRDLPHYRHALPRGYTSTSIFFHYVPADFAGSLR